MCRRILARGPDAAPRHHGLPVIPRAKCLGPVGAIGANGWGEVARKGWKTWGSLVPAPGALVREGLAPNRRAVPGAWLVGGIGFASLGR